MIDEREIFDSVRKKSFRTQAVDEFLPHDEDVANFVADLHFYSHFRVFKEI